MAFGIYKVGQGYWVRVLTAALAGALVLAAGAWGWSQARVIKTPTKAWDASVTRVQGTISPGATVQFLDRNDPGRSLAMADVESVRPDQLRLRAMTITADRKPGQEDIIRVPGGPGQPPIYNAVMSAQFREVPVINPLYIQAGVLSVVVATGGLLIFWFVGVNKRSSEFLIATDGEMKKVNWSTRKEVIGSTWVVIIACLLMASVLFVYDTVLSSFFKFVGVLERPPEN
ncbi:MAG: preprotein translocase subunit SecE [Phycisphaeraceae bacterium]|nr:preprotein translocase subunit SecE [Phycisphaeraceae bacterium]MCW5753791.1 preprotein translocase subunit SecE [Phycisphaeraceae bacterium]